MQIRIASASDQATVDLIRPRLEEAGHIVTIGFSLADAPAGDNSGTSPKGSDEISAVAMAVVNDDIEPAAVVQLWAELTEAQGHGLPILVVTATAVSDVPAAAAALPHQGEWIRIHPAEDPGCRELLGAITAVSRDIGVRAGTGGSRHAVALAKARTGMSRMRTRLPKRDGEQAAEGETAHRKRVFVAYSREDSAVVDSVCGRLERAGYDVWRDTKSIPGGARWRDKIGQAISEVDYVLLLLSFNVIKKPHYQQAEIDLADAHQKTIIPLLIDTVPMPPKGFEVILSGVEYIPLHNSFEDGIGQLLADLGEDAGKRKRRARERARDALTEARDAARRNQLGKKAKNAALVGLGVTVAALGAALAAQMERDRNREAAAKAQQAQEEHLYREKTIALVFRVLKEIELAQDMTAQAYHQEFRPKVLDLVGQLKGTKAPNPDIARAHAEVVDALNEVLREFDEAIKEQERGDNHAWARAVERLNLSWATSLKSSIDWLLQATGADTEPPGGVPAQE